MRIARLLFAAALILASTALSTADVRNLCGIWKFRTDPTRKGEASGWERAGYDCSDWDDMAVPGNWNTLPAYSSYTGDAWYLTDFDVAETGEKPMRLRFDGVTTGAEVWLNGERLGKHDFPFAPFAFDVTGKLQTGSNRIAVKVSNLRKVGATWNYGGIRRPVSLETLKPERIEKLRVSTALDKGLTKGEIEVAAHLRGEFPDACRVRFRVISPQGKQIGERNVRIQDSMAKCVFMLKNPALWWFDNPELYTVEACVAGDTASARTGFRRIEVCGEELLINGEVARLCGANWVPDCPFTGNTLPPEVYRRDIDMMKAAGVNMARLSHQGLPGDVLDYLDEKGIMIFEEIPLWNKNSMVNASDSTPLRWLEELIGERINHPCIIGWSVGNEIGRASDNPELKEYLGRSLGKVHELDAGRLAVYVTHTAAKQPGEPASMGDMILFNQYGAHGERADRVHEYNPGKPIFYSEYGKTVNRSDLDADVDYRAMLDDMSGRDFIAGASVWTFNDYRTNYRDRLTDAAGLRPWGAVDAYRRRKRAYRSLQRANSPLDTLYAEPDAAGMTVFLRPRDRGSIPSWTLRGYSLEINAFRGMDTLMRVRRELPLIRPGEGMSSVRFDYAPEADVDRIEAVLMSPAGYVIDRFDRFMTPPVKPEILGVESSDTKCRVHFRKDAGTREYAVEIFVDGNWRRNAPTIESFQETDFPEFGKEYELRVAALNECRESLSEIVKVIPQAAILPPAIIVAERAGSDIHVAFSADMQDFYYEVTLLAPGEEPRMTRVPSGTGSCVIGDTDPDKNYKVSVRRVNSYGYASAESVEAVVKPIKKEIK